MTLAARFADGARTVLAASRQIAVCAWLTVSLALPAAALEGEPLRIGFQSEVVNVLLTHALSAGLFDRRELKVAATPFAAGPAMLPALAADELDLAWMGEFPAVSGYANGLPIVILFVERLEATNVRLVASRKAGIDKLEDLKGKTIGVTIGSTSHYHALRALHKAGLAAGDTTLVNLSPANMPPAYAAGQIDAAVAWEPNVGAMERQGARAITTTRSLGMITGGVWVARKAFVETRPGTLARFLKAWNDALEDLRSNPDAVRAPEAKRLGMDQAGFDRLLIGQGVSHPTFEETLTADLLGPPGEEARSRFADHLKGIGAFLVAQKRVAKAPADWTALCDTRPVQALLAGGRD